MQSRSLSLLSLTVSVFFALTGCQTDIEPGVAITPSSVSSTGNTVTSNTFRYTDAVFYYRDQSEEYVEMPLKNQAGTYGSSPKGLIIDPATGAINVNKSESGLTYRVWFKPTGSSETVSSEVTIAGINFQSRVYNLASGDVVAKPFYNVQHNAAAPFGVESKAAGSEFANDNDRAVASLLNENTLQRKPNGVEIDGLSGAIDLRKAVDNGVFGVKPIDGTVKTFRLYYRLNDGSRKALNYIDVRLHYYSRASAVPSSLLSQANYKTSATFRQATPSISGTPTVTDVAMNTERPTRPPDIIIVGD